MKLLPDKPKLTAARQKELWHQAMAGDLASRDELIEDAVRLNIRQILPGLGPTVSVGDLIAEAWLRAATYFHKWNPEQGTSFRCFIGSAFINHCRSLYMKRGYDLFYIHHEARELATKADPRTLPPEKLIRRRAALRFLNSGLLQDGTWLRDVNEPQIEWDSALADVEATEAWQIFQQAWYTVLDQRERDIVASIFGSHGRPQQAEAETARHWRISKQRANQIKHRAIHKLREALARHAYLFQED